MMATFIAWIAPPVAVGVTPPPTEGVFDFVVATAAYSEPAGEGPFDFIVEV